MEILRYKDFEGSTELDMERKVCRGKLLHIDDLVTFESDTIEGLQAQFEEAVEDYLETCREIGKEPQRPYKGQFNVRVSAELHRSAARRAVQDETSLNDVVIKALESYLSAREIFPHMHQIFAKVARDFPNALEQAVTPTVLYPKSHVTAHTETRVEADVASDSQLSFLMFANRADGCGNYEH